MSTLWLFQSDRDRILTLAHRLGVEVEGGSSALAWPLPLLEKIVERLEALEKREEPENGLPTRVASDV